MQTRRDFIRTSAALAAGTLVVPLGGFRQDQKLIGLALYTIRGPLGEDLEGTLARVAAIGYNYLEAANYRNRLFYGKKPAEFRKMVEGLGMKMISTHSSITAENIEAAAEDALLAGMKYMMLPSIRRDTLSSVDGCRNTAEMLNLYGEICNAAGIRFGYHNHDFEFVRVVDKVPYDLLLEWTDPRLVTFQPDLYWMVKAGVNPVDYFTRFRGRFEVWHLKDMEGSDEGYFAEIGQGIIDFPRMFTHRQSAGMEYFFVEQDTCRNHPPLESIRISYEYLKGLEF